MWSQAFIVSDCGTVCFIPVSIVLLNFKPVFSGTAAGVRVWERK